MCPCGMAERENRRGPAPVTTALTASAASGSRRQLAGNLTYVVLGDVLGNFREQAML